MASTDWGIPNPPAVSIETKPCSAADVLIVRGTAEDLGPPAQVPAVVAALAGKYTSPRDRPYLLDADPSFDVVYAVRPRSALAWRMDDYDASQRRWAAPD